ERIGDARPIRRGNLVPPRRPRSGDPHRADVPGPWRGAAGRRDAPPGGPAWGERDRAAHDERPRPNAGADRRWLARLPGLLRAPPPGADRARGPIRGHRARHRAARVRGELGYAEIVVIAPS